MQTRPSRGFRSRLESPSQFADAHATMNFILGTAGHIDHGKSSLVRALTGTDPDRLPEEQKRGVTIELGFAHLELTGPNGQDLQIGLVDVPGHADFVNNMVAGVGALDLALFVVAADDGWMPQSEEHLHILSYLGVKNAIIAVTKIDLAEDPEFAVEFVRDSLQGSAFEECPIIPVSSHTGQGLPELKSAITEVLATAPLPEDLATPCLPVDRAFSVKGMGTVITGTLSRGSMAVGDKMVLQPEGLPVHVRSIQNHNRALQKANPGMRTAVNIPDAALDSRKEKGVKRGQLITPPNVGTPSDTVDVWIERLARPIPGQIASEKPLRNNQKVRLHHGSGRNSGRIRLLAGEIRPGQSGLAQLRLDSPLFVFTNDRIVVREWSGEATLAGARILDPHGSRRHSGKDEHQNNLQTLAKTESAEGQLRYLFHKRRFLAEKPAAQDFPFSNRSYKDALKKLAGEGVITKISIGHAVADWWQDLFTRAQNEILAYHQKNPDLPGLSLQDFRAHFRRDLSGVLYEPLLATLKTAGIIATGEHLKAESHQTDIPEELRKDAESILKILETEQLNAPTRKDLATSPARERALAFLIRVQQAISLDEKTILHPSAITQASELIVSHIQKEGPATASDLRKLLDTSRRVAMPLFEHLDAIGVTRRDGDLRHLPTT